MTAAIRYGVAMAVVALAAGAALAQQERPGRSDPTRQQEELGQQERDTQRDRDKDRKHKEAAFHLTQFSKLKGTTIKNTADEDLGEIKDLAVAPQSGRIAYAAVAFGGFLGMGEKLFAVPVDALDIQTSDRIVLNVTKQDFENAEGFDDDNWPLRPNERFASNLRSRHMRDIERARESQLAADRERQRREDQMRERERTRESELAGDEQREQRRRHEREKQERITSIKKASELVGKDVKNPQGEDLGSIEDLYVDPERERVCFAVLSHGGVLGIGDDRYAVPWQSLKTLPNEDHLVLNIDKSRLENAPKARTADRDTWNNPDWVTTVYRFYAVEPYWEDESQSRDRPGTPRGGRDM